MKIRVNPHNVEILREETEPINELEVKVSKCEFEFDEQITNEFVKEAYFTLNGSTYKQIIVNNECDYPNEVLTQKGTLEIGVVAYKVVNNEEIIRYNPSPDYYDTWVGSLKDAENTEPLTPSDKEQMQSQISQNTSDISDLQANKQDKLTAGDNITIDENNVISAVDTIYDDTEIKADIQELQETKIDKDVNNLTYYTLTTETGSKIDLSINSSTYVMTLKLKDKNNNDISTDSIDLPLETMVVGARYDSTTKEIVLTLKNGQEVRFSVADLVSGLQTEITENNKLSSDLVDDTNNTNKFVSASEKAQITTNKNDITAIKDGEEIDSFSDVENAFDGVDTVLGLKEDKSNKVTEINSSSTDTQYPSAKCVYDSQEEQNEKIAELEMLYNAFPTVSAEDTTIQLDNTAKVKFREIDLKGNTSQVVIPEEQGTSVSNTSIYVSDVNTDKENNIEMSGNTYQETTTGINVYNVNGTKVNVSPEITIDSDYYVSCTYNNSSSSTIHYSNFMINKNDLLKTSTNYLIVCEIKSVSGSGRLYPFTKHINSCIETANTNYPFSTLSAGYKILIPVTTKSEFTSDTRYDLRTLVAYAVGESGSITFRLSLLTDTTITSDTFVYEKFTFGASPNPSYPQNIEVVTGTQNVEVCGKNLFDKSQAILGRRLDLSGNLYSESGYYTTPYIRVNPSTKYIKNSPSQDAYHRYCFYTKNKTFISQSTYNLYTMPSRCEYVRFCGLQSELDTTQFEQGDTSTTYEAYQGTTYPVNLGNIELCKISTYQDRIYKRNDKWYLYKEIGKITLNGTETVTRKGTNTTGYYRFAIDIGRNIYSTDTTQEDAPFYCNKFVNGSRGKSYTLVDCIFPTDTTFGYSSFGIYYDATKEMTSTQFQNWLSQNGIVVYYPYATPTTTEITDTNLVNQLNALYNANIYPITNINTDTSNLLPYIDLHYNFVTPSPSPSRPSVVNVVKGNNTITISNSDNTESQVFPINLGDMELCKIGTYQDYIYESNGNWFKKDNIGKVVLNGSEDWEVFLNVNYEYQLVLFDGATTDTDNQYFPAICSNYINRNVASSLLNNYEFSHFSTKPTPSSTQKKRYVRFRNNEITTLQDWKNNLESNNSIIYIPLATPTDTQITDTTLITQLDNLQKAISYDSQTNISQNNTDKPFIIYAEAIRSLKDVFE